MDALYPLFLKLAGRDVVVVGAGNVAERKILELVVAGARVRVIAPEATPVVRALVDRGVVAWAARGFDPADADGAWLLIAATSRPDVQRAASDAAEARRVFALAVDDLPNGSAYGASVVRRAPITVAISSNGEAPALIRLLREIFEEILPDEGWVEEALALRAKWRRDGTPFGSRFGELVRAYKARGEATPEPAAGRNQETAQ